MTQNHLAGLPICAERRFGKMGKTIKRLTFSTVCASTTEVKTMFCHYHWLYVSRLRTAGPMVGGWCSVGAVYISPLCSTPLVAIGHLVTATCAARPLADVTTTISPSSSTATESQLCSERLQAGKCCVVTLQLLHSQPPQPPLTLALIVLMSLISRTFHRPL